MSIPASDMTEVLDFVRRLDEPEDKATFTDKLRTHVAHIAQCELLLKSFEGNTEVRAKFEHALASLQPELRVTEATAVKDPNETEET